MPPLRELSRDYEDELDATENAGRRGWPVWPWIAAMVAGYLVWVNR